MLTRSPTPPQYRQLISKSMNREIKFRGISLETGEWVYGTFQRAFGKSSGYKCIGYYITVQRILDGTEMFNQHEVKPETVGQCLNRTDRMGMEVCEGDVIQNSVQNIFQIKWDEEDAAFVVDSIRTHSGLKERYPLGTYIKMLQKSGSWFQIIGTIHSPLLATEGEKA